MGIGVALALAAGRAYWWFGGFPSSVAPPEADAAPQDVVETYLEALDGHDCERAEGLWVDKDAHTWCGDVASITSWEIEPASSAAAASEYAVVQVSFDLDWRPFHDDGSVGEGDLTWSYTLTRPTGGPWRLYSEGMG